MNLFKTLQVPEVQRYWIRQARVPICFLPGGPKTAVDRDGATLIDLLVDHGRIAAIEPAGAAASADLRYGPLRGVGATRFRCPSDHQQDLPAARAFD